ncbi:phenylacetate--CoA ligase family protein [Bradyrhizobium zhanjiangense]|uniref:Phenylacetate--CoA ligase family protein n=1 Tax=Bradyrhizobium zhanjiangense TaxID=1325107 RepID=A0A4Q0QW03_9BRAD|nr:phenylacetate--CoA ligase family protein [Bradyrhizobium zhanjiangense]RXH00962.1 phenylacetate--CoA ligase family protein [Bradyrhizobium zhanjiangense]
MSESISSVLLDAHRARRQGLNAIAQRQRARLGEAVAFARANSPYYRELYQGLPERIESSSVLPVAHKQELMRHFDDWVTDREVSFAAVRAFVDNPELIGQRLLGKYSVATTSGTTGTPGIFLLDEHNWTVTLAFSLRMMIGALSASDMLRLLVGGGRAASVLAMGGHYIGATRFAAIHTKSSARRFRALPAQAPLQNLVAELNRFCPALLIGYASVMALLAAEQDAGRLHIRPALVLPTSEGLSPDGYDRIARAFHAKVRTIYVATECLFMAIGCEHGWHHVNSDWAILEPVDASYRPVPPGEESHTVLVSNLANRVQPILRYDLGDRILQRPDPCPCGNPLPAIRVRGRAADILTFPTECGEKVAVPSLALEIDHVPGVELLQIVQTAPTQLRVRLHPAADADPNRVWRAVHSELTKLLNEHGLGQVSVELAPEPPVASSAGKYRTVIPLVLSA